MKWQDMILEGAFHACQNIQRYSPDPSTHIGVSIVNNQGKVLVCACNGFPAHIRLRLERPEKYSFIEHAERNAIYHAAREGIALKGATLFMIGMGPPTSPCVECARAIIQSGIIRVVGAAYKPYGDHWASPVLDGGELLHEAGVSFHEWDLARGIEIESRWAAVGVDA